jgi:hypothetical protein
MNSTSNALESMDHRYVSTLCIVGIPHTIDLFLY